MNLVTVAAPEADGIRVVGSSAPSGIALSAADDPLSVALVHHVARMNFPLVVSDTHSHPLLSDTPRIRQSVSGACLGYPVRDDTGRVLAVMAAYCDRIHDWNREQQQRMGESTREILRYLGS